MSRLLPRVCKGVGASRRHFHHVALAHCDVCVVMCGVCLGHLADLLYYFHLEVEDEGTPCRGKISTLLVPQSNAKHGPKHRLAANGAAIMQSLRMECDPGRPLAPTDENKRVKLLHRVT